MTVFNVQDHGATGQNTVDNAVFHQAMETAEAGRRWAPDRLSSDPHGSVTIEIPAGDYRTTGMGGFIGAEDMKVKARGLRFRGAGSDLTHIIFDPAEPGALIYNMFWQNVAFEGITFSTTVPGSTFMHSVAVNGSAPQDYTFTDVKWNGPWKYGFNLEGTNNNCEFRFIGCMTTKMQGDGAFLYVGKHGTSDQFLNYWFYAFKHWSTDAPLIDMAKGGHVHLFGLDASAWGTNLTEKKYLINLRGNSHSHGVQTFTATGLRVEPKNVHAALLYSEWASGNVDIQCDWSSQINGYQYGDIITIDVGNVSGPAYNFHDSHLAGGVNVKYGWNAWEAQHRIVFNDCVWRQKLTPSEVVSYTDLPGGANPVRPAVTFEGCRGENNNPFHTQGASVWDATISHEAGALVKPGGPRTVTLRGIRGSLSDGAPVRVNLPVGAIITGLDPVASVGTWSVETSTGEHVAATGEPVTPFVCDTRGRATILVHHVAGANNQRGGFLNLTGYW